MASRPDYLRNYDAQSFPVQMARNAPFVPPADYPMDEFMLRPKRPRTPPMDYPWDQRYPFGAYASEVVRTTAESRNPVPNQPDYPAPMLNNKPSVVYRRQPNPNPNPESPIQNRARHSSGMNKAFLHHARNFDKFATIKGRGQCCSNCPICKAIRAANVALIDDDTPSPGNTPPMTVARAIGQAENKSRPLSMQKYPGGSPVDLDDDDDPEAFQKEARQKAFLRDLTKRGGRVARVIADRVSRHVRELTITKGEYLEVLDDKGRWYACSNVSGQLGYVPAAILASVAYEEVALAKVS